MGRPLVTSAAEWDYTEALSWYAERSLRAAEGFEAEFAKALDTIGSNPQ
jgi:plasmid stabilization system protein ParE